MNCKANYDTILLGDVKMTIVFKVSEELQKKMIKYYENPSFVLVKVKNHHLVLYL